MSDHCRSMGVRGARSPIPPPLHPKFSCGAVPGGVFKRPSLRTQVLSQLSHRSTAHTRKSQGQWRGQGDWEYVHREEGSGAWEISLRLKGVAHTALKHSACGDRGRDCPLPL